MSVTFETYLRTARNGSIIPVAIIDGDAELDKFGPGAMCSRLLAPEYVQSIACAGYDFFIVIPKRCLVQLDEDVLDTVLLHEEAHCILRHVGHGASVQAMDQMELEADAYTGKSAEQLRQMHFQVMKAVEVSGGAPMNISFAMSCIVNPTRMTAAGHDLSWKKMIKYNAQVFWYHLCKEFKKVRSGRKTS